MRIRGLSLFRRYHVQAFIVFLLLLGLVLISLRAKDRKGVQFFDAFLMELCSPVQSAASSIIKAVQGAAEHYFLLVRVQKENELLRRRVAELQEQNHQMKEMAVANERFRRLLQFREAMGTKMVAAEVIGQDPSSWFKSVTINKGERDGVQKGMAVITPDGVVGQVLKTSPHYATLLLLTDYNSAIDAIVQRTRAKAIVEGKEENRCQLKYLLRSEDVVEGDVVVTSGFGGKFPKGLLVGEIRKVEKRSHGVFQYAELVPSVDFTKLEEVFVLTESSFPLPQVREKKVKKSPVGGPKKK